MRKKRILAMLLAVMMLIVSVNFSFRETSAEENDASEDGILTSENEIGTSEEIIETSEEIIEISEEIQEQDILDALPGLPPEFDNPEDEIAWLMEQLENEDSLTEDEMATYLMRLRELAPEMFEPVMPLLDGVTITGRNSTSYTNVDGNTPGPYDVSTFTLSNGREALCIKHTESRPNVGNSSSSQETVTVTDHQRAVIYFGWSNPASSDAVFRYDGSPCYWVPSGGYAYEKGEEMLYMATSLIISQERYGSGGGLYSTHVRKALDDYADAHIGEIPNSASITLSKTAVSASVSGTVQKSESITFGNSDGTTQSIDVTVPSTPTGVTITVGGNTYTAGQNIQITEGQSFTINAPKTYNGTVTVTGKAHEGILSNDINVYHFDGKQSLMTTNLSYPQVSATATFTSGCSIKIVKSSSDTTVTSGNGSYSLQGAVFGVYTSSVNANADTNRIATMTTDAAGTAQADSLDVPAGGKYYVKEITASTGYNLNTTTFEIAVSTANTSTNPATVSVPEPPKTVSVAVAKQSAQPAVTNGSSCYSLQGAVFGLYLSQMQANQDTARIATLTTDAAGKAQVNGLAIPVSGKYYIKELTAPKGFTLDATVHELSVTVANTSANPATITIADKPKMDPVSVLLTKQGEENEKIAGAQYTFKFYNGLLQETDPAEDGKTPTRTWVFQTDTNGQVRYHESTQWFVSGDDFYADVDGTFSLPYGTLTIQETLAPTGYELNPEVYVRKIEPGTNAAVSTYNAPTTIERPTRGDFAFKKLDADTDAPLANVKFTITSPSGEVRTVWTDENGVYSTASSFIPHSTDTNAGTPGAGIWFGSGTVDDDLGACPFGTYTIKEQRCDANKDKYKDLAAFTVTIAQDGTTVDIGDVYNYPFPTIQTKAWDMVTGTNLAVCADTVTVTDTVTLDNLETGHSYTLKSRLMDKAGGEVYTADGQPVTMMKTFTATEENMVVDTAVFQIRTDGLQGRSLVFFEELYDDAYPDELIAAHTDMSDDGQTIHFPEIGTIATGNGTTNMAPAGKETTITDTVVYKNLVPGKEYTLTGTVMDKASGEAYTADGQPVTVTKTFTPETENGCVDMVFTFNAESLSGKDVVIFEELYHEGLLAIHADIDDEGQTIHFPEIGTTATGNGTTNMAPAGKETTITDTVAYKNLVPGKEYTLTGTVMDKASGEVYTADGQPVTVTKTFTPETENGCVDMVFTFNAESLSGKDVVIFEELYHEGLLAIHADIDDEGQTIHFPEIGTTATGNGATNMAPAGKETTITDTVAYKNLVPGKEYTLTGTVMDKASGEVYTADGQPVTVTKTFTPETENGCVDMVFTFNAESLSGKDVVIFEELYHEGLLAIHADIDDEGQTIHFPEIGTTANLETDVSEDKPLGEVTIIDIVMYKNLVPGKEYTLTGTVMDKASGEAYTADGQPVTVTKTFTPETENGCVDMVFTFNAESLSGKDVVIFEELYHEGLLAIHADIDDDGQTVTFPPYTPPVTPPKTGDAAPLPVHIVVPAGLAALAGIVILGSRKKRNK